MSRSNINSAHVPVNAGSMPVCGLIRAFGSFVLFRLSTETLLDTQA